MTTREFYKAIIDGDFTEEVQVKASELLEKMDEANAKRAQKILEKKATAEDEKAPIRQALMDVMSNEPMTAAQLLEQANLSEDVKVASVPSLLKPFIVDGEVVKVDVKVNGKKMRGYCKA